MSDPRAVELLQRVERRWRPLRDAAERLGLDGLMRVTPSGWTAKEMLAHVAFWEEAVEGAVRGLFRGESIDGYAFGSGYVASGEWPRADMHNAREAAWAREQSAADVVARWERAHASMVTFLATVTDEEIAAHEHYFGEIGEHFAEHLPELDALLMASQT